MSKDKSLQLAEQLHALQRQYFKTMLLGKKSQQQQQHFIAALFQLSTQIKLNQVIDVEQLVGVVQEQALTLNLAPELLSEIGEIIQNIHIQLQQSQAPLSSFISDQQLEHWLRKILEMDSFASYIHNQIENTPQIRIMCAYWVNQNIEQFIPSQITQLTNKTTSKLPQRIQRFLALQQQKFGEKFEEKTAQLIQKQLLFLFGIPKDEYLTLGLSIWDNIKHKSISELAIQGSPIDMEEIFILSYESWKDLRHNPNIQKIIRDSIEHFYHTFEDESLYFLFQSTGLKVENIQTEAKRFATPIVRRLEQLNLLDRLIDLHIQPFFKDKATLTWIENNLNCE